MVLIKALFIISFIGCITSWRSLQSFLPHYVLSNTAGNLRPRFKSTLQNYRTTNQTIFVYSAFIRRESTLNKKEMIIVVLAWQIKRDTSALLKCCILNKAKNEPQTLDTTEDDISLHKRLYMVRRVACLVDSYNLEILGVSLVTRNMSCPIYNSDYVKPVFISATNGNRLAMCNKYLYGSINIAQLVEWIEIHRFFGVDKFIIHYDPAVDIFVKQVLQFYEKEDILEALSFKCPPRERRPKLSLFNDEQLALLDCRERYRYFMFAADVDLDEFLIPNVVKENALKEALVNAFKDKKIGVLSLYVSVHLTLWKAKNRTHPMLFGQYEDATYPIIDRTKNVYMPSRVLLEKGYIHDVIPKQGFSRIFVDPEVILLHHFRRCRPEWYNTKTVTTYQYGKNVTVNATCNTFSKLKYSSVKTVSRLIKIRERVQRLLAFFNLRT